MRRVGQRTGIGGRPALGVVMKELTVGLVAEGRIPCGAKDEAVPRLVHRVGRHADDLAVAQCGRTTPQPLTQTGFDERPRLPRTRLEHGRRQVDVRNYGPRPVECVPARESHDFTLGGRGCGRNLDEWLRGWQSQWGCWSLFWSLGYQREVRGLRLSMYQRDRPRIRRGRRGAFGAAAGMTAGGVWLAGQGGDSGGAGSHHGGCGGSGGCGGGGCGGGGS